MPILPAPSRLLNVLRLSLSLSPDRLPERHFRLSDVGLQRQIGDTGDLLQHLLAVAALGLECLAQDVFRRALDGDPLRDIALLRAEMDAWPGPEPRTSYEQAQLDWVEANDACRRDILARLERLP